MPDFNPRQQTILKILCAYLIFTMLVPPFYFGGENGQSLGLGYGFLFYPPHEKARVDVAQLAAQWFIGIVIAGIAFLQANGYGKSENSNSSPKLRDAIEYGIKRAKWFLFYLSAYSIAKAIAPNSDPGKQAAYGLMTFIGLLPVYIGVIAWHARKMYQGFQLEPTRPEKVFSLKRVGYLLLLFVLVGIGLQSNEVKPWQKNWAPEQTPKEKLIFDDLVPPKAK